jgi:MtN3 and saliva related transmembrane protein
MQWEIIGYCAGLITMFGNVPQILKIHKTKSVNDISLISYLQQGLGISLWLAYSLHIQDKPMIMTNAVTLCGLATVIIQYLKYRKAK